MPMEPIWLQCYCAGTVRCERCGSEAVRDLDTAGSKLEWTCADCGTVWGSSNPDLNSAHGRGVEIESPSCADASRPAVAPVTMTHAISAARSDASLQGARRFQGHDLSSRRRGLLAMMSSVFHWTERMVWRHQPIIR
jgi:hypothetical protein